MLPVIIFLDLTFAEMLQIYYYLWWSETWKLLFWRDKRLFTEKCSWKNNTTNSV